MSILLRTSVILSNPTSAMPETTSETATPLPATLTAPVSLPKVKKRRRKLTNAHRVEIWHFLSPSDEIIDDSPDDDQFIEQLAQSYAKGPEVDPDAADVPVPTPISIPQALGALTALRTFAEQ